LLVLPLLLLLPLLLVARGLPATLLLVLLPLLAALTALAALATLASLATATLAHAAALCLAPALLVLLILLLTVLVLPLCHVTLLGSRRATRLRPPRRQCKNGMALCTSDGSPVDVGPCLRRGAARPTGSYKGALARLAPGADRAAQNRRMNTETSIGPGANRGGNDSPGNADGCGNKTLGERAPQQAPAGADIVEQGSPEVPAGVPGARPRPGVKKGPEAYPDGPNVEASPWELEAARGKLPTHR
jgi:hypothetical protein